MYVWNILHTDLEKSSSFDAMSFSCITLSPSTENPKGKGAGGDFCKNIPQVPFIKNITQSRAQVLQRRYHERVGRGRGCSFYLYLPICEFSLFFEWNMTFVNENFHCSGRLRTLVLRCSIFVFLYSSNPLSEYPLLPAWLPPQPTLRYWQWIDLAHPPSPVQLLIQEEKRQQWWRWYRDKEIHNFFSEPRLTTQYIQ